MGGLRDCNAHTRHYSHGIVFSDARIPSYALCDPVADARVAALRGLGDLYAPGVVEPMAALLKDENPVVRGAAAGALRSVPVGRGRGRIMAVLEASLQDEDAEVRKEASESLRGLSR